MSDSARDLLTRGVAAAKAGEQREARRYLEWMLLQADASEDQKVDAWFWLSEISQDPTEQRRLLEEILSRDPLDARARRKFAILTGQLKPESIINPESVPAQSETDIESTANRFTCPTCGGRMIYAPDGVSLTCEYCESRRILNAQPSPIAEQDFILSMATVQAHWKPVASQFLHCEGCGASFLLPPERLSITCPYCLSAHVIASPENNEFVQPAAVIPFTVSAGQAADAIRAWLDSALPEDGRARVLGGSGLYLPVWAFRVGGTISWRGFAAVNDRRQPIKMMSGQIDTGQQEVLVTASTRLPEESLAALDSYDMNGLVPYQDAYLSDWVAETYQVPVVKAALQARAQFFKAQSLSARDQLQHIQDCTLSSADLKIESFRLLLFPAWISRYRFDEREYSLVINGQTGSAWGQRPSRGLGGFLDSLFGGD